MADDFLNGLSIVPLDADHSILSSGSASAEHPWRDLFRVRREVPNYYSDTPCTKSAPFRYMYNKQLRTPSSNCLDEIFGGLATGRVEKEPHGTIRLCDVEAFRKCTAEKVLVTTNPDGISELTADLSRLSTSSSSIRPVIYRYVDVIKNSIALLEAIHFELFMPDRPDLRFLAVPFPSVPTGTIEGDYFRVPDSDLLSNPSFAVKLGNVEYPVVWEAKNVEKMSLSGLQQYSGLAYIVKKKEDNEGCVAGISDIFDRDFPIRNTLFPDEDSIKEHSIVVVTMRDMATAHLHTVEPPTSCGIWETVMNNVVMPFAPVSQRKRGEDSSKMKEEEKGDRSEYIKRVCDVFTSSQRAGRVVTAVRALSATEAAEIEDRLGAFRAFGRQGCLQSMIKLFRLGTSYRISVARGVDLKDVGATRIDESIILKTLDDRILDYGVPPEKSLLILFYFKECGEMAEKFKRVIVDASTPELLAPFRHYGGLQLNEQQALAVRLYAGPTLFPPVITIRSPPGSGKTTVAAAMAAEVGRSNQNNRSVQLLLSVQNVDWTFARKWTRHSRRGVPEIIDFKSKEEYLTYHRRECERHLDPKMVLQKMCTESKLCDALGRVRRVIIDEASLLTEAALFCIMRRFPKAKYVLIGDDRQLPPFMYDEKILGHELAGRPALSLALSTAIPVVELSEVYRAPPSLVAPYNRLAYGGKLVSKKAEGDSPLTEIGLIDSGKSQLLMIDVDGREEQNERTKSFYNEKELEVLLCLLKKFPREWTKDIMIICLYKEQKKRLQEILDKQYKLDADSDKFNVLTVDSAQGKESPIVIIMTTRTQRTSDFFCSTERCNVAVSRQQKALIILGKVSLLITNKPWSTVVNGDDFTRIKAEDF